MPNVRVVILPHRHQRPERRFTWLVRRTLGMARLCRGTIDASTGKVDWWSGLPKRGFYRRIR